jgi:hypothetical protein
MDLQAQPQSDYDFVEWSGRATVAPPPAGKAALRELDTATVWLSTDRELRYWTDELGVTIYEIRDAIAATGTRCGATIRQYLLRLRTRSEFDLTV